MKNTQNQHDMTKFMIEKMRTTLLKEATERDTISPTQNDPEFKDEYKKLADTVDPRLLITRFKIYPRDRNVELDGRLDSGINFFMSVKEMKLSISVTDDQGNATKIYLDDELLSTITKLNGYYENWTREWATKLNTDYKTF